MSGSLTNPPAEGEITRLLRSWREGSRESHDALWRIVYDELRGLAASILRGRGAAGRRQPTSLVHQAYLRLLGAEVDWNDRRHFFAVAARAMRFVLADEARRQLSGKRGGGEVSALDDMAVEVADPVARQPEEVLAVHQALERLATIRPRYEQMVELRHFAGLSVAETADVLGVTPRTVARDWKAVKGWMHGELKQAPGLSATS